MFKILAVDDDLLMLELYQEIFSKAGFEIYTAEDASGAMVKFHELKPDLVVLDVDMPAGGGQKVFNRLRSVVLTATPIIFATGVPKSVANLAKNFNVAILEKPIKAEVLLETVKRLLRIS